MALFDNKLVILTGGLGIGKAACHLYARAGAKTIISEITENGGYPAR